MVAAKSGTTISSSTYSFDSLGRKTEETTPSAYTAYGYDAGGQLTSDVRTGTGAYSISYTYDNAGNHATKVLGGTTVDYAFNGIGQRVGKSNGVGYILADDGTLVEVTRIAELFKARAVVLTGSRATVSRTISEVEKARYVHLATHGSLNEKQPMYSSVILTREASDDEFLTAGRIAQLNLRAELVVLSACEAALGQRVCVRGNMRIRTTGHRLRCRELGSGMTGEKKMMNPLAISRAILVALSLPLLWGAGASAQKGEPPPLDMKAVQLTAELFAAIRNGDRVATTAALDHGADPNRPNWIQFMPADWAMLLRKPDMVELLVSRGAKLSQGAYGSPIIGAVMVGQEQAALALFEKGAGAESKRPDKASALMMAAAQGAAKLIDRLKPDAAELAKQDIDGATALIYAARLGQLDATKRLLAHGAVVDATDSHARTPLMYAALNGHKVVVDALLAAGAKPNLTDKENATALHLAARYSGEEGVAKSLLKAKVHVDTRDATGKTPLTLAESRRFAAFAEALKAAGARHTPLAALSSPKQAVERSVVAMQGGMKRFLVQSECVSCHHQGLGLAVLGRARLKGFSVDQGILEGNLTRISENLKQMQPLIELTQHDPKMAGVVPTSEIDEVGITASYLFWALEENQSKATPEVTTFAQYVASQQNTAGNWSFTIHRGPLQESFQTATAFQILGMRRYLPAEESAPRVKKAQEWLRKTPVLTTEDSAARLLGLHWSGLDAKAYRAEITSLVSLQRPDGGWGMTPGAKSNALSTGLALYSLRVAGALPRTHPAVQKATQYLLRTQDESGTWYMNKTIPPFNYFFDTGFPAGEAQYISFGATGWATLALMEVADRPKVARR